MSSNPADKPFQQPRPLSEAIELPDIEATYSKYIRNSTNPLKMHSLLIKFEEYKMMRGWLKLEHNPHKP